jgi:hypothetical protein
LSTQNARPRDLEVAPRWARPREALKVLPIGMTKLYELMNDGRIRSKKVDGMRLVDLNSLDELA